MIRQHSSSDMSGVTVTVGFVMQSAAVRSKGFRPLATMRQTISRSVTTPIGALLDVLSTTGISPQSLSTIIRATSGREVSAVQHAGSAVIMSFTCIVLHPPFPTFKPGLPLAGFIAPQPNAGVFETNQPPAAQPLAVFRVLQRDELRLEQSSTLFRNAYVPVPLCSFRWPDSRGHQR